MERYKRNEAQRFFVLGGPSGYLTCIPAGDRFGTRYNGWTILAKVGRPLTPERADYCKGWALSTFELA